MNSLSISIITITICFVGYFYSWKFQKENKYEIALILLVACGFILRIYTSSDMFLHNWDERYHALVAKNLIQHPLKPTLYDNPILHYDYKNWTANHVWLHKQPFPLWTMALSMWIFGINELSLRIPSILLSSSGIWLIFYTAVYFFNKKTAYIAALLFSINGLIIELTAGRVATDHIDIFFLFFIQLAVFFCIKFSQTKKTYYNILIGISVGLAILTKWLPALIVVPVWLLILIDSDRRFNKRQLLIHFLVLIFTILIIILPWQFYIFNTFPVEAKWESGFNIKHITEVLENQTGPYYYFFDKIRINYGELIYIPIIWFIIRTLKNIKDLKSIALILWFFIPIVFFTIAKTKMQAYILFTSPVMFMITGYFYESIIEYKKTLKIKWGINIVLILLIALPVRYSLERIKPFKINSEPNWITELKKLNKIKVKNGVIFNYDKPIEAMFYTNFIVYPDTPDIEIINKLLSERYTIFINDNGNISNEIHSVKNVTFIKIN